MSAKLRVAGGKREREKEREMGSKSESKGAST